MLLLLAESSSAQEHIDGTAASRRLSNSISSHAQATPSRINYRLILQIFPTLGYLDPEGWAQGFKGLGPRVGILW